MSEVATDVLFRPIEVCLSEVETVVVVKFLGTARGVVKPPGSTLEVLVTGDNCVELASLGEGILTESLAVGVVDSGGEEVDESETP